MSNDKGSPELERALATLRRLLAPLKCSENEVLGQATPEPMTLNFEPLALEWEDTGRYSSACQHPEGFSVVADLGPHSVSGFSGEVVVYRQETRGRLKGEISRSDRDQLQRDLCSLAGLFVAALGPGKGSGDERTHGPMD